MDEVSGLGKIQKSTLGVTISSGLEIETLSAGVSLSVCSGLTCCLRARWLVKTICADAAIKLYRNSLSPLLPTETRCVLGAKPKWHKLVKQGVLTSSLPLRHSTNCWHPLILVSSEAKPRLPDSTRIKV
jgi:hypothetical protein